MLELHQPPIRGGIGNDFRRIESAGRRVKDRRGAVLAAGDEVLAVGGDRNGIDTGPDVIFVGLLSTEVLEPTPFPVSIVRNDAIEDFTGRIECVLIDFGIRETNLCDVGLVTSFLLFGNGELCGFDGCNALAVCLFLGGDRFLASFLCHFSRGHSCGFLRIGFLLSSDGSVALLFSLFGRSHSCGFLRIGFLLSSDGSV
ncbi:MAG: hypothetical protein KY476_21105, partial [Planctomycetes bacterium]|nr:hypothetical protein [Planctomycetota bacterium]